MAITRHWNPETQEIWDTNGYADVVTGYAKSVEDYITQSNGLERIYSDSIIVGDVWYRIPVYGY